MQLTLPEVLVTSGPQYATQINSALDVVDAHDHSTGKGVRITPSGLNINADLSFGNNQATGLKAVVLQAQSAVASLGALYNIGGNLFYRDGGNNAIQLTSGGTLNVSSVGAITGLTSPASASFVSLNSSFVFQSNATTYGKLEIGDVLIYSRSAAVGTAQAVTLVADPSTSAYSLRLPVSAPADNTLMRMKSGVNVSQFVTLLGTTNQVSVAHNTSDITLSLPQNIHTGASPTFVGLTLSGALSGATTGGFSGQVNVGALVSAAGVSGVTGTFSGDVSAVNATFSGDLTLSGFLKSISGTFINATLRTVSCSNDISSSTKVTAPTLQAGTNTLTSVGGLSANQVVTPTILPSTPGNGIEIAGRTNTTPMPAFYVGEIVTASMGSNVTTSTGYQNLTSITLTAGVWEVSANAVFTWNIAQSTALIRKVETAISLSSGVADSTSYTNINYGVSAQQSAGESVTNVILSRRVQVSTSTTVYLVGRSNTFAGGTNNAYFDSLGTIIKAQRVA
jgi:hypothetical protein